MQPFWSGHTFHAFNECPMAIAFLRPSRIRKYKSRSLIRRLTKLDFGMSEFYSYRVTVSTLETVQEIYW